MLTWVGSLMYIQRLPGMLFGMDTMTNLGLFYLMIAPCGAALSLDRWLKVRRERQRLGAGLRAAAARNRWCPPTSPPG